MFRDMPRLPRVVACVTFTPFGGQYISVTRAPQFDTRKLYLGFLAQHNEFFFKGLDRVHELRNHPALPLNPRLESAPQTEE